MVNRHGYENKYINNWLEDTIDFIINDRKCVAEGNKLVNCKNGLRVMAGNITSDQVIQVTGGHPHADGCEIINNDTSRIQVGATYSSWNKIIPAANTILRGNTGKIVQQRQTGTQLVSSAQSGAGAGAVKLRPNEVGPWS